MIYREEFRLRNKENLGPIKHFMKQYPHILTKGRLLSKDNEARYEFQVAMCTN